MYFVCNFPSRIPPVFPTWRDRLIHGSESLGKKSIGESAVIFWPAVAAVIDCWTLNIESTAAVCCQSLPNGSIRE
jgi:hypothetical protein